MSVRTETAQELLENQDPSVLFVVNEVTKEVTPLEVPGDSPKPRKQRAKKEEVTNDEPAAKGAGE